MQDEKDVATDTQPEDRFADMRNAKPWLEDITESEKVMADWNKTCDNIDELYSNLKTLSSTSTEREMRMFWANLEVMRPSIYARPPVPVVGARFKDRKPLLRHASEILERCIVSSFDTEGVHDTMKLIRDDVALNSRGVAWLRIEDEDGQKVCYDHLDRKDFIHEPARKWKECGWVARGTWKTRREMGDRFGDDHAAVQGANYEQRDEGSGEDKHGEKKARVWEIWHKTKSLVVWVTPGIEEVLDIMDPFLDLEGFYPCPAPAYGTLQRGTLIPVPDFIYYKDQIEEINEMTVRISALSESLRMKGFYAAGNEDVGDAIETALRATDNNSLLIPVPNVAALGGTGMDKAIIWMPVDQVAAVIVQLEALRKQLIDDVYQITGLSDIMRGSTDANETLGAQQLKSQYGSVRIREKQEELIRSARDLARLSGEIIAENFEPQTLMAMSHYDEVPTQAQIQQQIMAEQQKVAQAAQNPELVEQARQNPEMAQKMLASVQQTVEKLKSELTLEQVFQFMRDQRMRPFMLEIETDSTIQPDENAAKERATEFLGALSQAMAQLGPMVAQAPESAGFAGEILKFAISPFRAGRSLDTAVDEFVEQMKQKASQPQPNPEVEKAKADREIKQAEAKNKQDLAQLDKQIKELDLAIKRSEGALKIELENKKIALEEKKIAERGEERKSQKNSQLIEAGLPPDYSFDDDRAQFQAMMQRSDRTDQVIAEMIGQVAQGQATLSDAVQELAKAQLAPKRVVKTNGEITGVVPVIPETMN